MKIHSQYAAIINEFLTSEAEKSAGEGNSAQSKNNPSGDRKEISGLMSAVQTELEKMDQELENDPGRVERLQSIKEKVEAGNYRVDSHELASKMLDTWK